ncbi:MAG: hypothetical protein ACJ0BQ_01990 [Coraliomargaritaceae bacterium]
MRYLTAALFILTCLTLNLSGAAKFNGSISFFSSGNLVGYNIPQIYNDSSLYTTGTLVIQIVGVYQPYYGTGLVYGNTLYTSDTITGIYPGYAYNNDTGVVAFADAPSNYNYLWVGLYEFNGYQYVLSDYQNIPVSLYFGSTSPTVDPPSVDSVNKTDLGITYDRYASYYLSVNASGDDLSYQWQYSANGNSWENVQDAMAYYYSSSNNSYNYPNSSVLNLENVGMQNSTFNGSYDRWPFFKYGYYRVVVSNSGGSTTSQSVYIGEYIPPPPPPIDSDGDGINDDDDTYPYDFDNDGINDSYETNTGTYVNVTDTGTDPNVRDSDGDGIDDGYETNTGTYLSSSDTGTNPNIYDTDGDGINDLDDYAPNNFAIQAPSLSISRSGDDIIITWPNNTGFELKHSTDLSSWFSTGASQGSYTETMDSAKFFMLTKN